MIGRFKTTAVTLNVSQAHTTKFAAKRKVRNAAKVGANAAAIATGVATTVGAIVQKARYRLQAWARLTVLTRHTQA